MAYALRRRWWQVYDPCCNAIYTIRERGYWRIHFQRRLCQFLIRLHLMGWWELPEEGTWIFAGRLTNWYSWREDDKRGAGYTCSRPNCRSCSHRRRSVPRLPSRAETETRIRMAEALERADRAREARGGPR